MKLCKSVFKKFVSQKYADTLSVLYKAVLIITLIKEPGKLEGMFSGLMMHKVVDFDHWFSALGSSTKTFVDWMRCLQIGFDHG